MSSKKTTTAKKQSKVFKVNYKEIIVAPLKQAEHQLYTLSFFSGVRGLDIGAHKAGFQTLFHSDWEPFAGKSFELNIPKGKEANHPEHLHSEGLYICGPQKGDINNLSFPLIQEYISEHLDLEISKGRVNVIHGGPPCQDFSKCNSHRSEHSIKNLLIFQLLRIIKEARPKVGLIEQVPDLVSKKFEKIWRRVRLVLTSMTEYYWDFKIMNAKHYGARQDRKRLIIMLVRRDLNVLPHFPTEKPVDLDKVSVHSLLPHVYHFSPGQFADTIKDAQKNVFCTMTATGSEWLYEYDGVRRTPFMWERLVLTELEGLKLEGIPVTHQKRLVGNMVQVSFAEALFRHIRLHILKVKD